MPWKRVLICFGALALARPSVPEEPPSLPPPDYKIVLPAGEAHELLPKTCGVCHKDGSFRFFLVASPEQAGVDKAMDLLKGKGTLAQVGITERPKNPHAATACIFCHLEQPEPGSDPAAMGFRTLDGNPASLGSIERLCEMCHPKARETHPKVVRAKDPAEDLQKAGVPVVGGRTVCSTCHDMHARDVGTADVRLEYLDFVAKSPLNFPHGNRAACRACHPKDLGPKDAPTFTQNDPTSVCTRCHTESHARIHPVGVLPSDKTYPASFLTYPLDEDGRVTCSTCHDHVCKGKLDPKNPLFLRGGPYVSFVEFCFKCHPKGGTGVLNPHKQVDERGNTVRAICSFCHREVPEDLEGEDFDPKGLLYLHSQAELCIWCHDVGPHPFADHLVEAPPSTLKRLQEYEKRHKTKLPLGDDNRVVCSTCHNPHGKGVLRGIAALGAGERKQLRVPDFELCAPCHQRVD